MKRSLVLLAQVMQIEANIVLVLNMADEARASGQKLDLKQMRSLLGIPIVKNDDQVDALTQLLAWRRPRGNRIALFSEVIVMEDPGF